MPRHFPFALLLGVALLIAAACQGQEEPRPPTATSPPAEAGSAGDLPQPAPPVREDFEGEPKLSLFPRVGAFSPEESDREGQGLWLTFIDHLQRSSGPIRGKNGTGFALRGIKTIDSVGYFSPLTVQPETSYRVTYRVWTRLPEGGRGGAGILEFDDFLWIPAQYPKSLSDKHFLKAHTGISLTGAHDGAVQEFTFRTGPKTRMIHLVFFLEGAVTKEPMVIDDIEIRAE